MSLTLLHLCEICSMQKTLERYLEHVRDQGRGNEVEQHMQVGFDSLSDSKSPFHT